MNAPRTLLIKSTRWSTLRNQPPSRQASLLRPHENSLLTIPNAPSKRSLHPLRLRLSRPHQKRQHLCLSRPKCPAIFSLLTRSLKAPSWKSVGQQTAAKTSTLNTNSQARAQAGSLSKLVKISSRCEPRDADGSVSRPTLAYLSRLSP